jgi:hypothetical protein
MVVKIKLIFLLLLISLFPAASFARPDAGGGAVSGFNISGTYTFVPSTPGGLSGSGYLVYPDPDFANRTKRWQIPGFTTWHSTKTECKKYIVIFGYGGDIIENNDYLINNNKLSLKLFNMRSLTTKFFNTKHDCLIDNELNIFMYEVI